MKYLTGLDRSRVMQLWNAGNDTASIAKLLCIQESLVANSLATSGNANTRRRSGAPHDPSP